MVLIKEIQSFYESSVVNARLWDNMYPGAEKNAPFWQKRLDVITGAIKRIENK